MQVEVDQQPPVVGGPQVEEAGGRRAERARAVDVALLDGHHVRPLPAQRGRQPVRGPAELQVRGEDPQPGHHRPARRGRRAGVVRLDEPAGHRGGRQRPAAAQRPTSGHAEQQPQQGGDEQPGQEGQQLRYGRDPVGVHGPAPQHGAHHGQRHQRAQAALRRARPPPDSGTRRRPRPRSAARSVATVVSTGGLSAGARGAHIVPHRP
ncbi:hypothetical protein [Streptomyces sp. NPDC021212]|uniref:hypothetical protein n=1 Tax=Streptomyces sp. NPDC021212 TaxID=3365118 RepID=UPI0037A36DB3